MEGNVSMHTNMANAIIFLMVLQHRAYMYIDTWSFVWFSKQNHLRAQVGFIYIVISCNSLNNVLKNW